jgi:hypothetical protein
MRNSPREQTRLRTWCGGALPEVIPPMTVRRCRRGLKKAERLNLSEEVLFWQHHLALAVQRANNALAPE